MKRVKLALLAGLSVLIDGYVYGTQTNLDQVLPFIHKILDPSLYPGDPYVATLSSFPSPYPALMAFAARFVPLPWAHLALFLAAKYLLVASAWTLGKTLFLSEETGWLSAFLISVSPLAGLSTILGDDPIMKSCLYPTSVAGPLALCSIGLFLRKRETPAFALLAATYYVNGLIANFVAVLFVFGSLPLTRPLKKGWIVFLVLWLPWLAWYARLPHPASADTPGFVAALKAWYPGHYFPSTWDAAKWERLLVYLTLFAVFIRSGLERSAPARAVRPFLWAFAAMWSAAVLFGEAVPTRELIVLQFLRSDALFACLGLVFAADYLRRLLDGGTLAEWALGALLLHSLVAVGAEDHLPLTVLLAFLLSLSPYPYARDIAVAGGLFFCLRILVPIEASMQAALAASMAAAAVAARLWSGAAAARAKPLAAALAAALFLDPYHGLIAVVPLLFLSSGLRLPSKILAVGGIFALLVHAYPSFVSRENTLAPALLFGLLLAARGADRLPRGLPPLLPALAAVLLSVLTYPQIIRFRLETRDFAPETAARRDWETLQLWVEAHTPAGSVFIVPPYKDGFRVFSLRTPYVEWVDGSAMHWSPGFEEGWLYRLARLGFADSRVIGELRFGDLEGSPEYEEVRKVYEGADERALQGLATEGRAAFVVREKGSPLKLPLLYANGSFEVYRLGAASSGGR